MHELSGPPQSSGLSETGTGLCPHGPSCCAHVCNLCSCSYYHTCPQRSVRVHSRCAGMQIGKRKQLSSEPKQIRISCSAWRARNSYQAASPSVYTYWGYCRAAYAALNGLARLDHSVQSVYGAGSIDDQDHPEDSTFAVTYRHPSPRRFLCRMKPLAEPAGIFGAHERPL